MSPRSTSAEVRRAFLDFFSAPRARGRPQLAARPAERSDADVHERGHGPVQGRLHRQGRRAPTRARPRARSASASAASTTTSRTSASPRATTRSSRCSATSRFGDYFKEDAIAYAWELLTQGLRPARRAPGHHRLRRRARASPADDEARAIWKKVTGFGDERILGLGHGGQLLADGRDRPLRPVHRDPLVQRRRPTACPRHASARSPRPTARAGWRSGTSSSCSSSGRSTTGGATLSAAAQAVRRHRRGPRAHRRACSRA